MRYAVPYIRVSHADEKRGLTMDLQLDAIRTYADRQGLQLEPGLIYADEGRSAFTNRIDKRPAFQRLLRDAKAADRRWSLVLVYKTDRFARDALLQLQCRRDLRQLGVDTLSATQFNPDDSALGRLNVVLDAGLNEYYSALLSERMRDVRHYEVSQQGRHVGPIPVGYDRVAGQLIPNDRAAAVLRAGECYASGQMSAAAIVAALNAEGYTNADGESFKVYAVEELLKNPVYAGFVRLHGTLYAGTHAAIWPADLWARIQEVAAQRARRRIRAAATHNPLLAGLIYCAHCGAPMWHFPRDGFRSYRCSVLPSKRPSPIAGLSCTEETWAQAEPVEAAVLAWVGALGLLPDLIDRARTRLAHAAPLAPPSADTLRKLKQDFLAERISAAEYEARRAALARPQVADPSPSNDQAVLALLQSLPTLLAAATPAERRAVLAQLITGVYAHNKAVLALRPTRLAETLFHAAAETADWRERALTYCSDGGPGGHPLTFTTFRKNPAILVAA